MCDCYAWKVWWKYEISGRILIGRRYIHVYTSPKYTTTHIQIHIPSHSPQKLLDEAKSVDILLLDLRY